MDEHDVVGHMVPERYRHVLRAYSDPIGHEYLIVLDGVEIDGIWAGVDDHEGVMGQVCEAINNIVTIMDAPFHEVAENMHKYTYGPLLAATNWRLRNGS